MAYSEEQRRSAIETFIRFDGMPISWSSSTSPDAEMANPSLLGAYKHMRLAGKTLAGAGFDMR